MSRLRAGYTFSRAVKIEAQASAGDVCESCGEPFDYLEVHHILPITIARECYSYIPIEIITSAHNAMCLCTECHAREDLLAVLPEQIEFILPILEKLADEYYANLNP